MNKQEAMKKLTDAKHIFRYCWSNDYARDGFEEGINFALETVNKLDDPEKPVLTKEEAKWIKKLKARYISREDQLYIIARMRIRNF